jgi:antitoxin ParD1/3/4
MAKTQTLSLGDYWNAFISVELEKGRYGSASEIVRDALRLFEQHQTNQKLELLRAALIEGEESGNAGILDMNAIRNEAKARIK